MKKFLVSFVVETRDNSHSAPTIKGLVNSYAQQMANSRGWPMTITNLDVIEDADNDDFPPVSDETIRHLAQDISRQLNGIDNGEIVEDQPSKRIFMKVGGDAFYKFQDNDYVHVKIIRETSTGYTVQFLEDVGAYHKGDQIVAALYNLHVKRPSKGGAK